MKGRMMKLRTMLLCCAAMAVALTVGYEYTQAASAPVAPAGTLKIGTVGIRRVLRECQRNAKYRAQVLAEQAKAENEMEKLRKEESALQAGLLALKPGTADYINHLQELLNAQAAIQVKEQLTSQERLTKDHRWTEDLYKEILQVVNEVAVEKGIDLVIESDDVEFPLPSSEELMMALRMHKLLYAKGKIDLTPEVIKRLDAK